MKKPHSSNWICGGCGWGHRPHETECVNEDCYNKQKLARAKKQQKQEQAEEDVRQAA